MPEQNTIKMMVPVSQFLTYRSLNPCLMSRDSKLSATLLEKYSPFFKHRFAGVLIASSPQNGLMLHFREPARLKKTEKEKRQCLFKFQAPVTRSPANPRGFATRPAGTAR